MNGTTSTETGAYAIPPGLDPEPEKVFRAHDAARAAQSSAQAAVDANADLAKAMKAATDRIELVTRNLTEVMSRQDAPAAAISSTTRHERASFHDDVTRVIKHGRLGRQVLENGDIAYSLPIENPWDVVTATVSDREAFIERGPTLTGSPSHIEIVGPSDRAIEAAVVHAKMKWGDQIRIHVGQKHAERVVRHAVEQGLTIVNQDPHILALVAAERERQVNPLVRGRDLGDTVLLERVPAGRERERERSAGREL